MGHCLLCGEFLRRTLYHSTGVLGTAGGVAKDQAEADEDMSLKQRAVLAGGSALSGASEMVDNEVVASAMEVGGKHVASYPVTMCCS